MHLHFEKNTNAKCDCNILSLSWMGKVPDEVPEDEGWTLSRTNYYQEGWLATGNARGLVGVTFTTSHCRTRNSELPLRANYNLRGHQSEVILVKWNEPYQKLASCDSSGVIFVWIKYEGRWSIELINDRSTPVTHFSWSHDGRMALICYRDGFVLVGSVAGQRYWSSMLNDQATITCGIWTPDDQQVYFGTTAGQLIVMDVHGAMVSEVQLSAGITSMAWSAEKFKMEEGDDDLSAKVIQHDERRYILAVCLIDGNVIMLRSYDDVSPITIKTGLKSPLHAEWSNSRKLLAIAGTSELDTSGNGLEYTNLLKFYSDSGSLVYTTAVPHTQCQVSALTWGHNDRRLFVATGAQVHTAWISRRVGSLQLLSRLAVRAALARESNVEQLPLPPRLRALVAVLFANTIRSCVPEPRELRKFVSRPPVTGGRLHCTMLRHAGEPAPCYTLYLEYLGGLVPLLKGRRTSKIRPEFVIFDPQNEDPIPMSNCTYHMPYFSDGSDTEKDTGDTHSSPRNKRKHRRRKDDRSTDETDDLTYTDTLPEHARLVEVTSNIWGTKFKIHGLTDSVPANLGQVTYRTSLLHLQPRQMTLVMTELRDDLPPGPDPTFNPNLFSEDEEEAFQDNHVSRKPVDAAPPIAPMTPRNSRLSINRPKSQISSQFITQDSLISPVVAQAEIYDDFSYIDVQDMMDLGDNIRATSSTYRTSRHNPPRCCDVPALQSPKNSVAPTQTLIATANSNTDYSGNIQRVKTTLTEQQGMRKEFENNKINQIDDKISLAMCPADIINTYMQNGQTSASRQSSLMTNTQAQHIYWNSSSVLGMSVANCNSHYVNLKSNNKSCLTAHLTSSPSNSQLCSAPNSFPKNLLSSISTLNSPTCSRQSANVNCCSTCSQCSPNKRKEGKVAGSCKSSCNSTGQSAMSNKNEELKFIDEESRETEFSQLSGVRRTPTVVSIGPMCPPLDPIIRSCSVGYLDLVDTPMIPCDVALKMLRKDAPNKRLVLVSRKTRKKRKNKEHVISQQSTKLKLKTCGKSKSLDSGDMFPSSELIPLPSQLCQHLEETPGEMKEVLEKNSDEAHQAEHCCPTVEIDKSQEENSARLKKDGSLREAKSSGSLSSSLDGLVARLRDFDDTHSLPPLSPRLTARLPRSSPSSPAPSKKGKRPASASPIRHRLLSSPLLSRRSRKARGESSDDEGPCQDEASRSYRNLETFQKAQLRQKLKQKSICPTGHKAEALVMHNKAPMWNEASQVYQLDFGGRVTQESAKNFQIEYRGKQVMQFGRIDGNAYTLDFQYPFSALQAFSVALANVTQRLK